MYYRLGLAIPGQSSNPDAYEDSDRAAEKARDAQSAHHIATLSCDVNQRRHRRYRYPETSFSTSPRFHTAMSPAVSTISQSASDVNPTYNSMIIRIYIGNEISKPYFELEPNQPWTGSLSLIPVSSLKWAVGTLRFPFRRIFHTVRTTALTAEHPLLTPGFRRRAFQDETLLFPGQGYCTAL